MSIVAKAKELLNQVLSAYEEEKTIYNSLTSFVIDGIEAESLTVNIPFSMNSLENLYRNSLKINSLILKKTTGNNIKKIYFNQANSFIKKIVLELDCSSLYLFNISGLIKITTIENVNFPLIADYYNIFPNSVIDVSFVADTISPKVVYYTLDFSDNENFSILTISSLCNAVQALTEEDISENGGYGIIAFSSKVFSLITDELSEAFLAKGWEVFDNG